MKSKWMQRLNAARACLLGAALIIAGILRLVRR